MSEFSKIKYIFIKVLVAIVIFASGVYFGFHKQLEISKAAGLRETAIETEIDFSPFWKVWDTIDEKFPDAQTITDQERVYGAISGLLGSLNDPYSVFLTPDEAKIFEDDIAGNFTGVGMEVGNKDNILTVIAPLKDTPAYRAGIKSGDKILKIDETSTAGLSVEKAIKLIRGEEGTTVTLTIAREGETEPREIKIVRDVINTPTLDTELRADNIFVIKLYSFSANSVGLFRNAIKQFSEAKTDKLLLDLRGNPGGYLDAAVDMASWFLPGGKTVVIEDGGKDEEQKIFRSKGYNVFTDNLKFVILLDSGSASASEILAGAMRDHGRAKIVGSQSFGKGSVQEVVRMGEGTILKITIAKWLTPNGISISDREGLTPDYIVPLTPKDFEDKKDPQMDKAVELLNTWPFSGAGIR